MDQPRLGELLRQLEDLPPAELRQLMVEARRRLGGEVALASSLRLTVTGDRPVRVEGHDGARRAIVPGEHLDLPPLAVVNGAGGGDRGLDLSGRRVRSVLWCRLDAPEGRSRVHASLAGLQAGSARFGAPESFVLGPTAEGAPPTWRPLDSGSALLDVVPEGPVTLLVVGRGIPARCGPAAGAAAAEPGARRRRGRGARMTASPAPRGPSPLRVASSRTRTAPLPLRPASLALDLVPHVVADALYAGPPLAPTSCPLFPGQALEVPFADVAVQVLARFGAGAPDSVVLVVDLGADREVARLELYGNALLPPLLQGGRPVHNFGLPRTVRVGCAEAERPVADRHRRGEPGSFSSDPRDVREGAQEFHDLRALWGWTPLHLSPALFGRYLILALSDLPQVLAPDGAPVRGLDLQALVIYPALEDVEHTPHVEYAPILSRQRAFPQPSPYWSPQGVAPATATAQAVLLDPANQALLLPSALCGQPAVSPAVGPVELYASDWLSLDPAAGDRAWLTLQATTDEVPVLDGVRLTFRPPEDAKLYRGPKLPGLPDYRVRIDTTSDVEAAFSEDEDHPGWRLAAPERLVRASIVSSALVPFTAPRRARWVRLTARAVAPPGGSPGGAAPFLLHRLDLLRCRDFVLAPDLGEDHQVDVVLLRLRGEALLDDYARLDGEHGASIAVELSERGGPPEELRAFRTVLELFENTHHRVFANQRRPDKPVQRLWERTRGRSRQRSRSRATSAQDQTSTVLPAYGNRTVTRAGTFTEFTDRPRDNLGEGPLAGLPDRTAAGLRTTRTYALDLEDLELPSFDPLGMDPGALLDQVAQFASQLSAQGVPVSLGVGGNVGGNVGISAVGQVGGSAGLSVNVGGQVGGGVTDSTVTGSQGSVAFTEARTVESSARTTSAATTSGLVTSRGRTLDVRSTLRRDLSTEVRRRGLEVRHGGRYEDVVLVSVPVGRLLRGLDLPRPSYAGGPGSAAGASAPPDELRVRVHHLPPGVRLDVEFRGRVLPRPREG